MICYVGPRLRSVRRLDHGRLQPISRHLPRHPAAHLLLERHQPPGSCFLVVVVVVFVGSAIFSFACVRACVRIGSHLVCVCVPICFLSVSFFPSSQFLSLLYSFVVFARSLYKPFSLAFVRSFVWCMLSTLTTAPRLRPTLLMLVPTP